MLIQKKIISASVESVEVGLPAYYKNANDDWADYFAITEDEKVVKVNKISALLSTLVTPQEIFDTERNLVPISEDEFFAKFNHLVDSFRTTLIPVAI